MQERLRFEQEIGLLAGLQAAPLVARETEEGLPPRITHLSLLPHNALKDGKHVPLSKKEADPGFYDGPTSYKIAEPLQDCLMAVMKKRKFAHIPVALVDLTGSKLSAPHFAGYMHKKQIFVASVAKIAAMLAAYQLRHDLQVAAESGTFAKIEDLFSRVRDDWIATQADPGGPSGPLGGRLSLRGKLVLSGGNKIGFGGRHKEKGKDDRRVVVPKAPRLKVIIDAVTHGKGFTAILNSSRDTPAEIAKLVTRFNKEDEAGKEEINSLGFIERLSIAMAGAVPASNFAISTVIRDLGFHYIASTLLQTGLFDPQRNGGLWLGADYRHTIWDGLPGVHPQSATAASLAAFMVLLVQDRLVSPAASAEMRKMLEKPQILAPGAEAWFRSALVGNFRQVLSKVGLADGADEVAFIDRDVFFDEPDPVSGSVKKKTLRLRYAVAALRAKTPAELKSLIRELDKCILANNGVPVGVGMGLP